MNECKLKHGDRLARQKRALPIVSLCDPSLFFLQQQQQHLFHCNVVINIHVVDIIVR